MLDLLTDVRVVAFTQFLFGPQCAQYLADMGADVVKIEDPRHGAWERRWSGGGTFKNGISAFFMLSHRNVRSLTANLKHPDGQRVARDLVRSADVLLENFRPGVMDRLGLGYDDLRELNPRLIYASGSGYGKSSPYRDLPGQDLLLQAMSGMAWATGTVDQPPTPAGSAVVDQHAASLLAMGILAALHRRERTNRGQQLEVSMLKAALDLQQEALVYHMNGGYVRRPRANLASTFHEAPYGVYKTGDGHIALSLSPLALIAEALGDPPELQAFLDPAHALERRDEIYDALAPLLRNRGTADLLQVFQERSVWCARVNSYDEVEQNPAVQHLNPWVTIEHQQAGQVRVVNHPVDFSGAHPTVRHPPPDLGEHTQEVLLELGRTPAEIASLRTDGAI